MEYTTSNLTNIFKRQKQIDFIDTTKAHEKYKDIKKTIKPWHAGTVINPFSLTK